MQLKLNLNKNISFLFFLVIISVILIFGVIAYGTNNPSTFGHSLGEIDGLPSNGFPSCSSNQALTRNSEGTWSCVNLPSGSSGGSIPITTSSCFVVYQNFGSPGNWIYSSRNIPSACQDGKECLLIITRGQVDYPNATTTYRQIPQITLPNQASTSGTHWLKGGIFSGINGNSVFTEIISIQGQIILYDDHSKAEKNKDQWSIAYNGHGDTDYKIFACSL